MHQPDRELGPPGRQRLRHRRGRAEVRLLRFLDHGQDDVRLPAVGALLPHEVENLLPLARGPEGGADGASPGRPLPKRRDVEIAVQRERERARDRRRGEQQDVGGGALPDEGGPLLHAETMLLVDDHEPQPPERDALLHEGMGANSQSRLSRGEPGAHRRLLGRSLTAEKQLGADAQRLEQHGERGGMLLRQQLGRRHQRGLEVVLHRQQHGEERHHRLAGPHVAHQQPVHAVGRGHVGGDLAEGALLIRREGPGQRLPEPARQVALHLEGDTDSLALGHGPRPDQHQLEVEQLVERQSAASPLGLLDRGRPVHRSQRLGQGGQSGGGAHRLGHRIARQCDERIEVPLDQSPDDPVAQSFGRGVDRQDLARGQRIRLTLGFGEHDVLPWSELPPMIETYGARHQQCLSHLDRPIEKRLARPHAFEHTTVIAQHGMKDSEPPPGRNHAFRHHSPDARHLLADFGAGEWCHGRRVDVSVGEVPEQVLRGADAEPLELLGAPLADPLEELDGRVQTHPGRGSGTWSGRGCLGHGPEGSLGSRV